MAYTVNLEERKVTVTWTFSYDEARLNEMFKENAEDNEQIPRNLTEDELGELLDEMGDVFDNCFEYALEAMYCDGTDYQRQIEFFDNLEMETAE